MTSARKRQPTRTMRQHSSTLDAPDPTDHDTATTATTARRLRRTLSTMKGQQSPTTSPSEEFHCKKKHVRMSQTKQRGRTPRKSQATSRSIPTRPMPTKNHLARPAWAEDGSFCIAFDELAAWPPECCALRLRTLVTAARYPTQLAALVITFSRCSNRVPADR